MSLCLKCGYCCRDWIGDDPRGTCEHLGADGHCTIYDRLEEHGRPECLQSHTPMQASSLPDHCGYIQAWLAEGILERNPDDGRWKWQDDPRWKGVS